MGWDSISRQVGLHGKFKAAASGKPEPRVSLGPMAPIRLESVAPSISTLLPVWRSGNERQTTPVSMSARSGRGHRPGVLPGGARPISPDSAGRSLAGSLQQDLGEPAR